MNVGGKQMTNSQKVEDQIQAFYDQHPDIQHRDQVQYVITADVFSKRMELVQTDKDRAVTLQQKGFLQKVNGNVVWGKTINDPITVLISERVFSLDD